DAATKELTRLGEGMMPLLQRALENQPSPEARKRIEAILVRLQGPPTGEILRAQRAIQVLEYAGSAEAGDVLKKLAGGDESARQTREAKEAVARLDKANTRR